jgi:uncharacterized membrane protein
MGINMKKYTYMVMLIAISVVGGMIKVPAIVGSVALDSFPALLASILLGPVQGGIVAFLGHFASSFVAGFPLGVFHLVIALEMFIILFVFGHLYKKFHKFVAYGFVIIANAFIAPLPFYFLMGKAFFVTIVPALLVSTLINVAIASLLSSKLILALAKQKGEKLS